MIRYVRGPAPTCLADNAVKWTVRALEKVSMASPQPFRWNEPCRKTVTADLSRASDHHCCFCDSYPLDPPTIEHFRPKSVFPEESFARTNLFAACAGCQGAKLDSYHSDLLRPDRNSFRFEAYFDIDTRFRIIPRSTASAYMQRRASRTIETFDLNREALRRSRHDLVLRGRDLSVYRFM